ncbi:ribbon-helix-helix protein, CopG family [archaeon]|jgi:metal-responsive CopG/Arc/MetJ family transcriptional regulator|nr:ribbon-helix-helix protein, CopG family [archaeon]MBT4417046.1 ribbon-helix-helix protein, CopG family [archaeon]
MKLMTFKISESLLEEMDKISKEHHFSNRTEFIRNAIREKIERCKTVNYISKHKPKIKKKKEIIDYTG